MAWYKGDTDDFPLSLELCQSPDLGYLNCDWSTVNPSGHRKHPVFGCVVSAQCLTVQSCSLLCLSFLSSFPLSNLVLTMYMAGYFNSYNLVSCTTWFKDAYADHLVLISVVHVSLLPHRDVWCNTTHNAVCNFFLVFTYLPRSILTICLPTFCCLSSSKCRIWRSWASSVLGMPQTSRSIKVSV